MLQSNISCLGNAGEALPRPNGNDYVPSHLPSNLLLLPVLLLLLLLSLLRMLPPSSSFPSPYPPQQYPVHVPVEAVASYILVCPGQTDALMHDAAPFLLRRRPPCQPRPTAGRHSPHLGP